MPKRRSTPPRGVSSLNRWPPPGPTEVVVPDESERGRPTVQEIAALEVVAALEAARGDRRDDLRGQPEVLTTQREMPTPEVRPAHNTRPAPGGKARPGARDTMRDDSEGMVHKGPMPGVPLAVSGEISGRASAAPREAMAPMRSVPIAAPRAGMPAAGSAGVRPQLDSGRPQGGIAAERPGGAAGSGSSPGPGGDRRADADRAVDDPERTTVELSGRPRDGGVRAFPLPAYETADPRLILQRQPDSPQAAAFRVLRYRIEQLQQDPGRTMVLAVCAPRPGQGATTAAANLALALSECNRARVCLMEGNLRRPALAGLFNFRPPACLAERLALDRDEPMAPWCAAELSPSLHVLAVRESSPRRPLVDGPAFAAGVMAMRRAGYRHVVIDGPEVLDIADMNLIEEVADGVLLVARGGLTLATDLRLAAGQLSSRKLRGVVLLDGEA